MSAIGAHPTLGDPSRVALGLPSLLLTDAVAQGLVRFDTAGQIEPGLAERWIVTDAGASYIFRVREARWADGAPVTSEQVVERLRRQIAHGSRNPLAPFLTAITEIVEMTPQVIEVRLKHPRPDLLKLFAQPEMSVVRPSHPAGSGPMQPIAGGPAPLLRPAPDPDRGETDAPPTLPDRNVQLFGEPAAAAVLRFVQGRADLVAGGTFDHWPLLGIARAPAAAIRVDPAAGLFGLNIVSRQGFLSSATNRAAVAQAIDGGAVTGAVAPNWLPDPRLLPDRLDSAAGPQSPPWANTPIDARRTAARTLVAAWGKPVTLRVALPAGPGGTLVWGQIGAALLRIGITPVRVAQTAPAELRLVDAVAPYDSARWYLAMACRPCGGAALARIEAARDAGTMAERGRWLAEADAALTADVAFIPLARPLRWSLVATRLDQWQPNPRAWHPLNRLRTDPT